MQVEHLRHNGQHATHEPVRGSGLVGFAMTALGCGGSPTTASESPSGAEAEPAPVVSAAATVPEVSTPLPVGPVSRLGVSCGRPATRQPALTLVPVPNPPKQLEPDDVVNRAHTLAVEAVGLPAVSTDGQLVTYLEAGAGPSGQAPQFDVSLVVEPLDGSKPQTQALISHAEWEQTLPPPEASQQQLREAVVRQVALRKQALGRIEKAHTELRRRAWVPLAWCDRVEQSFGERQQLTGSTATHEGLRVTLELAPTGQAPMLRVSNEAGAPLFSAAAPELLAKLPEVAGYDCGNAPYLQAVAIDRERKVLLLRVTQWLVADACLSTVITRAYRLRTP